MMTDRLKLNQLIGSPIQRNCAVRWFSTSVDWPVASGLLQVYHMIWASPILTTGRPYWLARWFSASRDCPSELPERLTAFPCNIRTSNLFIMSFATKATASTCTWVKGLSPRLTISMPIEVSFKLVLKFYLQAVITTNILLNRIFAFDCM